MPGGGQIGIGSAGLLVMGFSLLPDIMAHHTRTTGVALEGTMAAVYNIVEKGTAAVGPLIGGLLLRRFRLADPER